MRFQKSKVGKKFLEKQMKIMQSILDAPKNKRKELIKNADKNVISTLCESVSNILAGNIPITEEQKQKLKRHRKTLHYLCESKHSIENRKKKLLNGGVLLELVVPAAISGVASIIGSIINRNN